ncbi:MAG: glycosyltransferase family 4 protein [Gammaproteobacteria bacterium]|nr:glycosyltransferase family 4 protein [Gammaproteobacteria bacterium]
MKVLIFTSQFVHGAAERLGHELAIDLNRSGIHADLMSLYTDAYPGAAVAADDAVKRGTPTVHFLGLKPHPSPFALAGGITRLNRLIRREGYDIVETSSSTPGLIATWATIGTNARHVVGVHFSFDNNSHVTLSTRLFTWSVRLHAPRTAFYAVSNSARCAWEDYSHIPKNKIAVIFNCIQDRFFHATSNRRQLCKELGISTRSRLILCAGRIATYKQQNNIIDAVAPICEAMDIVVLFAGEADADVPGSKAMLATMIDTVANRGLTNRFLFLGYRTDLHALMASCDLFVHPSAKEAFGLVLAEALAAGLPIVSTDIDGTREVLEDTDSTMVPANDVNALQTGIIETILRTPERLSVMKALGQARASLFRQRNRTLRMLDLFKAP